MYLIVKSGHLNFLAGKTSLEEASFPPINTARVRGDQKYNTLLISGLPRGTFAWVAKKSLYFSTSGLGIPSNKSVKVSNVRVVLVHWARFFIGFALCLEQCTATNMRLIRDVPFWALLFRIHCTWPLFSPPSELLQNWPPCYLVARL